MSIFATLPAWAVGLLALAAGAMLLFFNYGWLLAVKAMLWGDRRKDDATTDAPAGDRTSPAESSAPGNRH